MAAVFGNIVSKETLRRELTICFNELNDILTDHSGPYATNCVIGSKWRQVNDVDEFTKDGIKILLHLVVSEDVIARFAARMVRFVGIAVDKRCHDGTTTSMLLFCRLAIAAMEKMETNPFSSQRYQWTKEILSGLNACLKYLEDLKITEEDIFKQCQKKGISTTLEDVRAAIAYHMAMISSKGDHDLSTKIAYVIKSCPRKIYGMFRDTPLAVETEEKYILKKQDFDIAVNGNIGNPNDYNYKSDSQFLSENAVVFATGSEIVTGSMEAEFLRAFISDDVRHRANMIDFGHEGKGWEHFHEGKRNLIIMTPLFNEPNLMGMIALFNAEHPDHKISWFNVQVHNRMKTSLNKTLHYMAGVPIFSDVAGSDAISSLIGLGDTPLRAHLIGHTMTLTGMYEKDGDVYHPSYRNPDRMPEYTRFVEETEDLINFANENISNPALDNDELTYLTSLYRSLTTQTIYDIQIGGSAHDQYANRTVYEDAIGAALSAVNEGVVVGGYFKFAQIFNHLNPDHGSVEAIFAKSFLSVGCDAMRVDQNDERVKRFILDEKLYANGKPDKWTYIVADTSIYLNGDDDSSHIKGKNLNRKRSLQDFLKMEEGTPVLLQAYGGYHEQFRRDRDMLSKLANTTHLADMRMKEGDDVR